MRVRELLTEARTHNQVQASSKKQLLDQVAQLAAAGCGGRGARASAAMNKLTPAENTLLGVVAGTEVLLVVQPMIFWKNAAQQGLALR